MTGYKFSDIKIAVVLSWPFDDRFENAIQVDSVFENSNLEHDSKRKLKQPARD